MRKTGWGRGESKTEAELNKPGRSGWDREEVSEGERTNLIKISLMRESGSHFSILAFNSTNNKIRNNTNKNGLGKHFEEVKQGWCNQVSRMDGVPV